MDNLPFPNGRCLECILWKPHYPGGKYYCHLNKKEYAKASDGISCALIELTHVSQDLEFLHQTCQPADPTSSETAEIIAVLKEELDFIGRRAVGLSANQLNFSKRIAVIRIPDSIDTWTELVLINPVILSYVDSSVTWVIESCLSVNNGWENSPAPRAREFTLQNVDIEGKTQVTKYSYNSHKDLVWAIQHEVDHLNGLTIVDYRDKSGLPEEARKRHELANIRSLEINRRRHTPIVKDPKIGRNNPCPCGSGKKFKLCCIKSKE